MTALAMGHVHWLQWAIWAAITAVVVVVWFERKDRPEQ